MLEKPRRIPGTHEWHRLALVLLLWAALAPGLVEKALATTEPPPPNIIFVMADDMGYYDLEPYGSDTIQTPNLQLMADGGMRFTNFYMNAAVCSPTRVALMTGRYPSEFGIKRAVLSQSFRGIPADVVTLPEMMKAKGYTTGHFGKWHVGHARPEYLPSRKGIDRAVVNYSGVIPSYCSGTLQVDDQSTIPFDNYLTEVTTDHALAFIGENVGQPFFVQIWYHAPHSPFDTPEHCLDPTAEPDPNETTQDKYGAMVEEVDRNVGRIRDELSRLGLRENTLLIFTSDNGPLPATQPNRGPLSLRGFKAWLFEAGIKVPMMAEWPGTITAGTTNDQTILGFDFYPTFLELAGREGSCPGGRCTNGLTCDLEGLSMVPTLLDSTVPIERGTIFWEGKYSNSNFESPSGLFDQFAVRKRIDGVEWKLLMDRNHNRDWPPWLFDIESDPYERTDLSGDPAHQGVIDELYAEYLQWRKDRGEIPLRIQSVKEGAELSANVLTFDDQGVIQLARDTRFDFAEMDLSLTATIRLEPKEAPSESTIAAYPGGWHFAVTPQNKLLLRIGDTDRSRPLPRTQLISQETLEYHQDYRVAFTIHGFRNGKSVVRLYIDGVLQEETIEIQGAVSSLRNNTLGNNEFSSLPFKGEIRDLKMYVLGLYAEELPTD